MRCWLLMEIKCYAIAIGQHIGFTEPKSVAAQLHHFGLSDVEFVKRFTLKQAALTSR